MAEVSDIDLSITALWRAWQAFERGKRTSPAILTFRDHLEDNLLSLAGDLQTGSYHHGGYNSFVVHDPKRREIAVAQVCDRIVHRLLYDYLVPIWDNSFCYDAWSCRKGKGLLSAVDRAQNHMCKYKPGWLWRSDISKFFDNVSHHELRQILRVKLYGSNAIKLLDKVIASYNVQSVSQSTVCPSAI